MRKPESIRAGRLGAMPNLIRGSRLGVLIVTASACLLAMSVVATSAGASTLRLTVGSEPVESITTQLGGTGTATEPGNLLYVKIQPTGGESCAANPDADHGEEIIEQHLEYAGPYSQSVNWTLRSAGSYLLCGWLVHESDSSIVAAAESISVRIPHLSLAIGIPATVQTGQTFQIATTAQAETSRVAWEYILPFTGGPCPANAAAASIAAGAIESVDDWNVVGGPFAQDQNQSLSKPGVYLACAYFEYPEFESVPEATASAMTSVLSPPPPCVVPQFTGRVSLGAVELRLVAAGCTVGGVRTVASYTVPSGDLVALTATPGKSLPPGSPIGVIVSGGRPCVVPVVHSGTSLVKVERQIAAANCTVGTVSRTRSRRVRRGRVLGISGRPHARLSPHAKLNIRISAGPPRRG